jgi:hypothetical protein
MSATEPPIVSVENMVLSIQPRSDDWLARVANASGERRRRGKEEVWAP